MKHPPLSVQTPSKHVSSTTPPVTPTQDHDHDPAVKDILRYTDDLEIHHDTKNQPIQFGHGVWSTVYKASSRPAANPSASLITPPTSPATTTSSSGRIVAVKSPVRRDALPVLEAEARILTRLALEPGSDRHVVRFWGFIPRSHSLVMAAVPLALSDYIEEQAGVARERRSTQSMLEPVLGMRPWVDLARKLISGLAWLHEQAQVVHGDIKPHNILLQPANTTTDNNEDKFPYEPLFADFSSAHDIPPTTTTTTTTNATSLTALTPPFAAPELLVLSALKSPDIHPTRASDVFSLAVTLLAAATGDLLLYPGTSHMQRLAMAREGHRVVEFARSGINGMRVPRNGVVEGVVRGAVCREPGERIAAGEWVGVVDEV